MRGISIEENEHELNTAYGTERQRQGCTGERMKTRGVRTNITAAGDTKEAVLHCRAV